MAPVPIYAYTLGGSMGYLFETHLHTSEASACAVSGGHEVARAYHENGYSGIIVTDHFFNGNSAIPRNMPWKDRVDLFTMGYKNAKEEGEKIGLTVLFGFEYAADGAEFLVYGLEPDFLYANEDFDKAGVKRMIDSVREAGGITSLAHPFREASHLYGFRLFIDTDAIEAVNAGNRHNPDFNRRAYEFALDRGKLMTAGSDLHSADSVTCTGMMFDREIKTSSDFVAAVKEKAYKLMLCEKEYEYVPKNYAELK